MGWNLGKKKISNHRFAVLTSVPIMGTKANKNKETKNNIIEIFNKFFWLKDEKKIMTHIPRHI